MIENIRPAATLLVLTLVLGGSALGCAPSGVQFDIDFCDGADNDTDGMVDEGRGTAIGCEADEICVGAVCLYDCGDGACTMRTGETCALCAADCGVCPACGDGECNGAENCMTCPGDCAACPFCGDGNCNAAETCENCRDDCGLCVGECTSCATSADCGPDYDCLQRVCDGARGCFSTRPNPTCPAISGESCPAVSAYDVCTTPAQCGSRMTCEGGRCTTSGFGMSADGVCANAQCPPAPPGYPGLMASYSCFGVPHRGTEGFTCELTCTTSCPYGMTCTDGRCV